MRFLLFLKDFALLPCIILFLFLRPLHGQVSHEELNGSWSLTSRIGPPAFRTSLEGLMLSFNDGKAESGVAGIPDPMEFTYTLKDSTIHFAGDSVHLRISCITDDDLHFEEPDSSILVFRRLKDFPIDSSSEEVFDWISNNAFYRINTYGKERIDFTTKGFWDEEDPIKYSVVHRDQSGCIRRGHERWLVSKRGENLFLYMSHFELERYSYHIQRIDDDGFDAIRISSVAWLPVRFEWIKPVSNEHRSKTKKLLTSKTWTKTKLVPRNRASLDSFLPDLYTHFSTYFHESFFDRTLTYRFTEKGKYQFILADSLLKEGEWKLTKDGRYIVLSNELASANYIEIVSLTPSAMRLEQVFNMHYGQRSREYIDVNCLIDFE